MQGRDAVTEPSCDVHGRVESDLFGLDCVGFADWVGLGWIRLSWVTLGWVSIESGWIVFVWIGLVLGLV